MATGQTASADARACPALGSDHTTIDVSYAAPQAHEIVNVALHREYSLGIVLIFSQGRKDLHHV
jgi:hypothetical protein